jgi:hypothetical protein
VGGEDRRRANRSQGLLQAFSGFQQLANPFDYDKCRVTFVQMEDRRV